MKDIGSSSAEDAFAEEYRTDSLGYIRINKLNHGKVCRNSAGTPERSSDANFCGTWKTRTLVRVRKFGA